MGTHIPGAVTLMTRGRYSDEPEDSLIHELTVDYCEVETVARSGLLLRGGLFAL
jgi:hypothetical protein